MSMTYRRRRLLALLALLGLLFQQVAMATYACPLESAVSAAALPPCHAAHAADQARCQQHCRPLAQTADHAPPPTVPPALLPATTWLRLAPVAAARPDAALRAVEARAAAPPLTVRFCAFLI